MAKDNFCIYCGFKLFPEDHFCPNCGKKLDEADEKPNNNFSTSTSNTTQALQLPLHQILLLRIIHIIKSKLKSLRKHMKPRKKRFWNCLKRNSLMVK